MSELVVQKDGKPLSRLEALAAYFRPGRIVPSYGGQDRVVAFDPGDAARAWRVTVVGVRSDGSALPFEEARTHFTEPSARNLKAVLEADGYSVAPAPRRKS